MNSGKHLRLRRILRGGRAIVVPIDHALYFGPIDALARPRDLVAAMVSGGVDGILTPPGALEDITGVMGDAAVLLRLDGTVSRLGNHIERTRLISSVEEASALGADAVVLNIYVGLEGEDELLAKLARVAQDCRRHGMVLVGEMIPGPMIAAHYGQGPDGLTPEQRAEYIGVAARIGAEIGVDLLKLNYSGSRASYEHVIRHAQRPVLVAGGVKSHDEAEFLKDVRDALDAGAAGICAGRNVWQSARQSAVLRALGDLVHQDVSLEQALQHLDG